MPSVSVAQHAPGRSTTTRLIRAGLVTGLVDGLWACALTLWRHGTILGLWQGVASVPFGKGMIGGGTATALVGIALHFVVAFTWSAVFLLLVLRSPWLRAILASPAGVLAVATVYGPLIWIVMSGIVIPLQTHQPLVITSRWWVQLAGHVLFVGLPIVATTGNAEG